MLPAPGVQQVVTDRMAILAKHKFYGVHIRRGDNEVSKAQSPTIGFIEKLKEMMSMDEHIHFYLSTDDKGEAKILKKLVGDNLHYFPAGQSRDKPKDIESALVDLLVLSKSERILGSYWSSFSEIAAEYGGVPIEMVKKEL